MERTVGREAFWSAIDETTEIKPELAIASVDHRPNGQTFRPI
jgi:hypothetical protein